MKIYNRLPIFAQNLACNIYGFRVRNRRYGSGFRETLNNVINEFSDDPDVVFSKRLARFKESVSTAIQRDTYFRDLFYQFGMDVASLTSEEEFFTFPEQNKDQVRKIIFDRSIESKRRFEETIASTSGTTGAGLRFPISRHAEQRQWATWWRFRYLHGIRFNTWCALFAQKPIVPLRQKNPPYWRVVRPLNQIRFSTQHLNDNNVKHFVDYMNQRKIPWIHGFPSSIYNLSFLMKTNELKLTYPIKYISVGAERLLENQKIMIASVFGITPIQHYGLTEPVANIFQCKAGRLHIDEDYSIVELIPIEDLKDHYRIIGTSIFNSGFQFMRYDTQDVVSLSAESYCPCGYFGRIIDKIEGRSDDYLTLPNGTRLGRLDHLFSNIENVREAQIIQDQSGAVMFCIVPGPHFCESDETKLRNNIFDQTGLVEYKINYVEKIPRGINGKFRFVISKM